MNNQQSQDPQGRMHRVKRQMPDNEARAFLRTQKVAHAATVDAAGWPYVVPLIFGNLVGNAIKFTPGGGRVTITLERSAQDAQIVVADTGVGIDPALLPRIFETFWQADASSSPSREGLGLGLSIVRRLVELHGGTIEAHSAGAGSGTRMTVRLPLAPEAVNRGAASEGGRSD